MTSRFALLTKQDKYSKASKKRLKTRTHKHKKVDEGGKGAVCWLREREKTERTWGKERVGTNFENILCRSEKEMIRSMYNKRVITIKRYRVTSVRVIRRSRRLIKVASNTRPYSQLTGTTLNGREEGVQYHISQTYDQERFEARKVVFSWECLNIFATGCSSIG